ncbi:FtsX-like permease family protein [Kitasatospora sp. NPDC051914]|uniref:FtsX-like permease family protein n=1 Tax=Kitasatospora sp. NPDC051914 TaxID=3154945 RepID=UPI00343D09AB
MIAGRWPRAVSRRLPLYALQFVLVAVLAAFAAAWEPSYDRLATRALAQEVEQAGSDGPLVAVRSGLRPPAADDGSSVAPKFGSLEQDLGRLAEGMARGAGPRLVAVLGAPVARIETGPVPVGGPAVRQPSGTVPTGQLVYAQDAGREVRWTAGRAPGTPAGDPAPSPVEVALSGPNADALGLAPGRRVTLRGPGLDTEAVVVGVFEPVAETADLWQQFPSLARPLVSDTTQGRRTAVEFLVGAAGIEAIEARGTAGPSGLALTLGYRVRVDGDGDAGAAGRAGELGREATAFVQGAAVGVCGDRTLATLPCKLDLRRVSPPQVTERLSAVVSAFERRSARTQALRSFALAGLMTVAVIGALAGARLAVRREADELELRRARGAGLAGLAGRRLLACAPAVLAGAVAGWCTAAAAVGGAGPTGAPGRAVLAAAGAAVLLVWCAPPGTVWARYREPRRGASGRGPRTPSARRLVRDATVLLVAAAGVLSLRLRGNSVDASDPQLFLLPGMLGAAAVTVLLWVYPVPVRLLGRWARRRTGAVPLVAFARAGREAPAAGAAVLVLVLALSGAVLGGLVSDSVRSGRERAAAWRTGADAVVLGPAGLDSAAKDLAQLPGVAGTVAVTGAARDLLASDGELLHSAAVVRVDPAGLLAAVPGSRLGRAMRSAGLGSSGDADAVPTVGVLADREVPDGELEVVEAGRTVLRLRIAGILPPAARQDPVLGPVLGELPSGGPLLVAAAGPRPDGPTVRTAVLLRTGRAAALPDAERLRRTAGDAYRASAAAGAPGEVLRLQVRSRAAESVRLGGDGLVRALDGASLVCGVAALLVALLVVAVDLLMSARERARTVACLRTLGMGSRAAAGLQLLELLPLVVAAGVGGTALGLLLPAALGPALDLADLTGAPGGSGPSVDWALTAALGSGLVVMVLAVAVLETVVGRRRRPAAVLRLGEAR